jgi:hypothetical protein
MNVRADNTLIVFKPLPRYKALDKAKYTTSKLARRCPASS